MQLGGQHFRGVRVYLLAENYVMYLSYLGSNELVLWHGG